MEAEVAKMKKFQDFLPTEDKLVFHDLLDECKLHAPYASVMASPVKEIPLLVSMLFGQHKRIIELEKKILELKTIRRTKTMSDSPLSLEHNASNKSEILRPVHATQLSNPPYCARKS